MADVAPSRVWVSALAASPEEFTLEGDEAHYLARVVRARAGDSVHATDGAGVSATLTLLAVGREVLVRRGPLAKAAATRRFLLACGAPEGDRADWLVEKLAELGGAVFQPVDLDRAKWTRSDARVARWRRLAVAALRQSLGDHLLEVREPLPLRALEAAAEGERVVAQPGGAAAAGLAPPRAGACTALVGGSSGFSAPELKWLGEQRFRPVALAASRLRTETAALAIAAWWAAGGCADAGPSA